MGPWAKVIRISMHVLLMMSSEMLMGLSRTHDCWPIDLHLSFTLGIHCLMTNTISFMDIVVLMHLWLANAVLDYNFMILSCCVYHFTIFQHSCPLRVLSLVLRELDVEDEEFDQYLRFCEHLEPCVLEASVVADRTDFGPRNVPNCLLQTPLHSTLANWYSWHMPDVHINISKAFAEPMQGPLQEPCLPTASIGCCLCTRSPSKALAGPQKGTHKHQTETCVALPAACSQAASEQCRSWQSTRNGLTRACCRRPAQPQTTCTRSSSSM